MKYYNENTISSIRHRRFLRKNSHLYTIICQTKKTTVWRLQFHQVKLLKGFTNQNPISDHGKLSGDAFVDHIIIPFKVFSETSPVFNVTVKRSLP